MEQNGVLQRAVYEMCVSLIAKEASSGFVNPLVLQKWRYLSNILSLMLFPGDGSGLISSQKMTSLGGLHIYYVVRIL